MTESGPLLQKAADFPIDLPCRLCGRKASITGSDVKQLLFFYYCANCQFKLTYKLTLAEARRVD